MNISLTADELTAAASVACRRRIESIFRRRKAENFDAPDEWTREIEGAAAEMAFARAINQYWTGSIFDGDCAKADVGVYGVRHTAYANGHLVIYEKDLDARVFVLVVGRSPNYRIVGSLRGRDAKKDCWWRADAKRPAWFVPQEALRPFNPQNAAVA